MTPDGGAVDAAPLLASALEQLRLDGAIFFRAEMSDPYAIGASPNDMAGRLHPGAERLLEFHIIVSGRCWIDGPDGESHLAEAGDIVVIPYGDEHAIRSESPTECLAFATLVDPPPWASVPLITLGGDGASTQFVCGYLISDDPLFDPRMRVFPPVFVVHLPDTESRRWVEASVEYAMQGVISVEGPGGLLATRLPELVVIEVLKAHLAEAPAADHGWLAALRDPVLGPALAALHAQPERRWTVGEIATESAVSRSALDERFRQVLGRSPIRYLAEWRMHLAREMLDTSDATIFVIARRVGYDSEEAFSRAFKREHGASPAHWRDARRNRSAAAPS